MTASWVWSHRSDTGITTTVDVKLEQQTDLYLKAGDHRSLVHMEVAEFSRLMQGARHGRFSEPWLNEDQLTLSIEFSNLF